MNKILSTFLILIFSTVIISGCDEIFGSKNDLITDDIFEQGRQDPNLILDEVGYAALLPFWTGFDKPNDVFVGYDELVYVTDANGLHVLDGAGRMGNFIPIRGAVSVTQDRLLNVYVAARTDTVITAISPTITWDLAAVYKIKNANGAGPVTEIQKLVHPFMDASRATTTTQRFRLDRNRSDNDELVEITGVTVLANNDIYVSRRGPRNQTGQAVSTDNTVLLFTEDRDNAGNRLGTMSNTTQLRTLNPNVPSLLSGIDITDVNSFIGPPQRENMNVTQSFLLAQGNPAKEIPFRVLWIDAVDTPDGIEYRSNGQLLSRDTSRANSFLYDEFKFKNPTGLAFSADQRGHIFVVDAETDSLYLFQSNGVEGVNPPAGSNVKKAINVSFGGQGSGPREFNNPMGVAYFGQIVFVADRDNNRIARYKLNTDIE